MNKKQEKEPTLEENFSLIEEIIEKMEQQDIPLEEAFSLYQQGVSALKECAGLLDAVEKKMLVLDAEGGLEEFA